MKIALLQCNFTVGDARGNAARILSGYRQACNEGADLVVGSELALFGYPPLDLLERPEYRAAQRRALETLRAGIGQVGLTLGVCTPNPGPGKPLHNSMLLLQRGQVTAQWHKVLLPTYDVFDEARYFEPGQDQVLVVEYGKNKLGLLLCEDIWGGAELLDHPTLYRRDLVAEMAHLKPDLLLVPNGSPYYFGKGRDRYRLVQAVARRTGAVVVYVNQVGANTELVFDGRSFVLNPAGQCLGCGPAFKEGVTVVDLDRASVVAYPFDDGVEALFEALVLGVRDYASKTGHQRAVVGLSGGIDSALTACIAVEALGADRVTGLIMPSPYSSAHSVADAQALAENLKIQSHKINISDIYRTYGDTLAPVLGWASPGSAPGDVTEENVQARIRGNLLMAFCNRHPGTLLLSTGNKSELAMGYCTLYGDMAGGLAVLSDVWKTQVYQLAEFVNREQKCIPLNTLQKPPSAELRPDQKDSDSLPPYGLLDAVLKAYLEERRAPQRIVADGLGDEKTVNWIVRTVQRNEFKRRQMPPGLKVTSKAFGSGRRMPIAAWFP